MICSNKQKYENVCKKEPIPILSQYWWLDAVYIDGEWDVALIEKNEEVIASLPYYLKQKGHLN